jgi:hypothetical protein
MSKNPSPTTLKTSPTTLKKIEEFLGNGDTEGSVRLPGAKFFGMEATDFLSKRELRDIKTYLIERSDTQAKLEAAIADTSARLSRCADAECRFRNIVERKDDILGRKVGRKFDIEKAARALSLKSLQPTNTSYAGGSNKAREAIESRAVHGIDALVPASPNTKNLILDRESPAMTQAVAEKEGLQAFLESKKVNKDERDKEVEKAIKKYKDKKNWHLEVPLRVLNNVAETAVAGVYGLLDPFLRGLITSGDPQKSTLYRHAEHRRNEFIAAQSGKISQHGKKNISNLELLKAFFKKGLVTNPAFQAQIDAINAEISKIAGDNKKELKELQDEINDFNEDMLEGAEDITKQSDDIVKFRLLQAFLIITPLGIFNYIVPLVSLFGPLFSAATFGEALAAVITSPVFGPFGDLAGLIGLDQAMIGLFGLPGLSGMGAVIMAVTTSAPVSLLGGALGAFVPVIPLGIAAIALPGYLGRERQLLEAKGEAGEKLEKSMKAIEDKWIAKGAGGGPSDEFFNHITDERTNVKIMSDLIGFISNKDNKKLLSIFDDCKASCDMGEGRPSEVLTLSDLAGRGELTKNKVADFLRTLESSKAVGDGPKAVEGMLKKFVLFSSIDNNKDVLQDLLSKPVLYEAKATVAWERGKNKATIEVARELKVTDPESEGASEISDQDLAVLAADCKNKILVREKRAASNTAGISGIHVPNPVVENPRASVADMDKRFNGEVAARAA